MSLYLAFASHIACSILLNDLILFNACKTLLICEDYMTQKENRHLTSQSGGRV